MKDEDYMRLALEQAKEAAAVGEVPIGAVVVQGEIVVGAGHNWRETWRDPTAHAEIVALQQASRRLGGWRLEECDLYVTLEPCPMCTGAVMLSRIRRLVYGSKDNKGGAVSSRIELLKPGLWNHDPEITGGILADECGMILKDFFQGLRNKPVSRG